MDRIIYLDRSILPTTVRRPAFEHEWIEYRTSSPEEVKARLQGATIAITHRVAGRGRLDADHARHAGKPGGISADVRPTPRLRLSDCANRGGVLTGGGHSPGRCDRQISR